MRASTNKTINTVLLDVSSSSSTSMSLVGHTHTVMEATCGT